MLPPFAVSVNVGETPAPAGAEFGVIEVRVAGWNPPAGVEIVSGREFDVPREFATVIAAVPREAVSVAGIEAINKFALLKFVAWAAPSQSTVASLLKFVPFTVSVKPCALQYGVLLGEVGEADRDVIEGGAPGTALIVKKTKFDTSVVVVLLTVVPD